MKTMFVKSKVLDIKDLVYIDQNSGQIIRPNTIFFQKANIEFKENTRNDMYQEIDQ